ncbi:helix-turn-helix domain-containing protein [Polynucleobacter rarus]|uniref:helix-turn-helix domain-containing protein n=1 Tax=Polynucleobacter rarus TaxID=556055 RepID=UPI000D3EA33F|nr:helix-turn-helix transcriptional regulator [Polynucleobacter rarus]
MKEKIIKSSGNVFDDLGFSKEESAVLKMRADLMAKVRDSIAKNGWTQSEAAAVLQISQSRVSDLIRGKRDKFSLDMLVMLATRAGNKVALEIAA